MSIDSKSQSKFGNELGDPVVSNFILISVLLSFTSPRAFAEEDKLNFELKRLGESLQKIGITLKGEGEKKVDFIRKDSQQDFKEIRKKLSQLRKELVEGSETAQRNIEKEVFDTISGWNRALEKMDKTLSK